MTIFHAMPGHLIRRLNQIAVSIFQDRMQGLGLDLTPVQFAALDALSDNPGIDQATLAGLIAHDRVTIGGVVDRLQSKGLVTRSVNENDRRARRLVLTDAGAALLARIVPVVSDLQDEILCGLAPDERSAFIALASKATEAANDRSRAPLKVKA
ncbi:MarR family transcriptional regulator [Rhodobacter sp. NTK016B]|uniref:MarR family winged helix-turn-helix transcriptional regulator n=1 Tax=Rhodobacter sp. NTK016B TaxID=2759676 RepID=UPI001A8C2229|nr:MarR family transcriptional regulator [Rhodobacter sp. NTK016B]MBN8292025.1 MarR family transcriptional regulator [Rhodobacter sp. NTK016B]